MSEYKSLRNISNLARTHVPYLKNYKAFIGGKWQSASSEVTFPVFNPANGEKLADVSDLHHDDVAKLFYRCPSISKLESNERSTFLQKWHKALLERVDDIAKVMTLEQGKPLTEAYQEVYYGASFIEWFAEEAKRINGELIPSAQTSTKIILMKQPVGVAALWTPWNFPLALITKKASAALAAGCTVLCKPSEDTPLTALALAQLAEEVGIPPGVFNVLPCSRDNVSMVTDAVMESSLVTKFSFTGSTAVGKLLLSQCANTVKRVSMELGGNAPFIVFNSADLDLAARGLLTAKFRNTGQVCIAPNRIFVQEQVYEEFTQKLVEGMKTLVVGDGLNKNSTQGPLINEKAVLKVETHIQQSVKQGAKVALGGSRMTDLGESFFQPTVLTDVTNDMVVSVEENFGPVVPLLRFNNEAEAIAMANNTYYGLAGYFYSQDFKQIWRVAEALEVGMVGVNSPSVSSEYAPFGGVKHSGIGKEGSKYGMDEFVEIKAVHIGGM